MIFSLLRRNLICGAAIITMAPGMVFAQGAPRVEVATNLGNFTIELYPEKAPKTVANFLKYVEAKHYDGTIFHRVIPTFMIQGGGFTPNMTQKPTLVPVQNEANNRLPNLRGTVAMARTGDPHSATAQFFVNVADNDFLNFRAESGQGWGYCVFGKVIAGMEVVDKIKAVPTATAGTYENVPVTAVVIKTMQVVDKK